MPDKKQESTNSYLYGWFSCYSSLIFETLLKVCALIVYQCVQACISGPGSKRNYIVSDCESISIRSCDCYVH